MGNRAIITHIGAEDNDLGIYVHWNGGQESVEGFLAAARDLGFRDLQSDPHYGLARLTQLIAMFFEGTISVGVGKVGEMDPSDNGVWTVGPDWRLVQSDRRHAAHYSTQYDTEKAEAIRAQCVAKFNANETS